MRDPTPSTPNSPNPKQRRPKLKACTMNPTPKQRLHCQAKAQSSAKPNSGAKPKIQSSENILNMRGLEPVLADLFAFLESGSDGHGSIFGDSPGALKLTTQDYRYTPKTACSRQRIEGCATGSVL